MHRLFNQPLINKLLSILPYAGILASTLLQSACVTSSPPIQPPYLREQADFFMQAGITSFNQFNLQLADQQLTQAKNFYSRYEDNAGSTNALLNLAQTNMTAGNFDKAGLNLSQANLLIERYSLELQAIYRDMLLTSLYLSTNSLGDANKIFTNYNAGLTGDLNDITSLNLLINRVRLAQISGKDFTIWLELYKKQVSRQNHADLNARLQRFQAWQAFLDKDAAQGNHLFVSALNYYRELANPAGLMATHLEWAEASSSNTIPDIAIQHYEQALYLAMSNNHVHNGLLALEGLRQIYNSTGMPEKLQQIDEWTQQLKKIPTNTVTE